LAYCAGSCGSGHVHLINGLYDAQRYRLGVNYEQISVNKSPYIISNYQRDGLMQTGDNGGANPNYRPNSFDDIVVDESYKEPAMQLDSIIADWFDRNENDDDHFTQPRTYYIAIQ
jgi:catalase